MPEPSTKIYLVAGATRGIGLALVDDIATKDPSAVIYAGARDPANGASQLIKVATKYPGRVEIVKYVAGDKEGNDAIAKQIGAKYGRVDTVIANAGIANYIGEVHEIPVEKFADHFSINVIGPIILFQSIRYLLKASPLPHFVPISSTRGSLELIPEGMFSMPPYGTSKAALNWVTRKIHYENEWLVAYPQCPGPVNTDMSQEAAAADKTGKGAEYLKTVFRPPNVAASMLVDILLVSTREKDGGEFHSVEGRRIPW